MLAGLQSRHIVLGADGEAGASTGVGGAEGRRKVVFRLDDGDAAAPTEEQAFDFCQRNSISNVACRGLLEEVKRRALKGGQEFIVRLNREMMIEVDGRNVKIDLDHPPSCQELSLFNEECERYDEVIGLMQQPQYKVFSESKVREITEQFDGKTPLLYTFKLCKGYANQRLALTSGLALAIELSQYTPIQVILPPFHGTYSAASASDCGPQINAAEGACSSRPTESDLSEYFDTAKLEAGLHDLHHNLSFAHSWSVEALPEHRAFIIDANFQFESNKLNSHGVVPILEEAVQSGVVHLDFCPLIAISWRKESARASRYLINSILQPSLHLRELVKEAMRYVLGGQFFVALHFREEQHWSMHCQQVFPEAADCLMSVDQISERMRLLGLQAKGSIYVATGATGETKARLVSNLLHMGFSDVLTKEDLLLKLDEAAVNGRHDRISWLKSQSRFMKAHLDFAICEKAEYFFGNYFSSFSYTLKEVRSVNSGPTERMVSAYLNGRNDGVELPFYDHDLSPLMK
eukprot:g3423.t1